MRQLYQGTSSTAFPVVPYETLLTPAQSKVKCIPSTPAPARKRRRPNQDLQERLTRCEEMLKEYAAVKPEPTTPSPAHALAHEDLRWQPTGKLVQEDGTLRFVDNPLLGHIYEEVRRCLLLLDPDGCLRPDRSEP
jgi:hypothetical protein